VDVTGPQTWVEALSAEDIILRCDASGLDAGVHDELPLSCVIAGGEEQEHTVELSQLTVSIYLR
jgi:hypothetical protein